MAQSNCSFPNALLLAMLCRMDMGKTDILLDGLCFGEGPRWHEGQLWLSDMHAHEVLKVSAQGVAEHVVTVENRPSGLGWLPAGDLLIVSMIDCRLLRFDGSRLTTHADLSSLASFHCNDMVVDSLGRAYVGNFGFDLHNKAQPCAAELILVEADGSARVVADDMMFPNGTVISADGRTLIVGESWGGSLTAFDIQPNGDLSNRRTWAELPRGAIPDGICLDAEGGIWSASPSTDECLRQVEGGKVTHRVAIGQAAFACMLGDDDLYILTAASSDPEICQSERGGRIEVIKAPYPGAGWP